MIAHHIKRGPFVNATSSGGGGLIVEFGDSSEEKPKVPARNAGLHTGPYANIHPLLLAERLMVVAEGQTHFCLKTKMESFEKRFF